MRYFPAFFDLSGRRVLVVGDGEAAVRKARLLLKAGANVLVVSPSPAPELIEEVGVDAIARRVFEAEDVDGCALVVAASEDETMDAAVADAAREAGVPVNVVDRPELCDFITPSIVDRGDVVVGISTGGAAPVLGRRLRGQIEALAPRRLGELAAFARSFRGAAASKIENGADRRRFWEETLRGPIGEKVLAGDTAAAREDMLVRLNSEGADPACGVVHIVGAGPGDPELLTLKALRVLQDADVILYDNLVDGAILDLARRDADRIYVGKKKSNHSVPQTDICDRLIALAREGKRVVRLKGGDPFIFGRGGEELEALKRAGVSAHIVPGVTAALGCAAEVGAPLTHRDHAQSVTFVTGHAAGGGEPDLDWASLSPANMTLVVYMGVSTAPRIARNLISHGRAAQTPVAVVENGTRPEQKIAKGELGQLAELIDGAGIVGPAILLVGEVARYADGRQIFELLENGRAAAGPALERVSA